MKRRLFLLLALIAMAFSSIAQIPTRDEFFKACDSLGVHHPYVVWAQARLESGNFKSTYYKTKKNCLGIYDSKRKCYASFASWKDCLAAYKTRFQYKCTNPNCTDEEYLKWLTNAGYAKDTTYYSTVIKIVNQEKKK